MKLISMTDYVLHYQNLSVQEITEILGNKYHARLPMFYEHYAKFLKLLLELWMFVPCDEDGKPMEEPSSDMSIRAINYREQYQKAQERVLFKGDDLGFYQNKGNEAKVLEFYKRGYETIEGLIFFDLELTDNAIKQLA